MRRAVAQLGLKGRKEALCCVLEQERHFILCLVLVQPRKTGKCPEMTEKLLTGM